MDNPPPTLIISPPQPQLPPQPFLPSSPPFPQPDTTTTTTTSSPPAPLPFTSSSSPQTQFYPITIVTINQPPPSFFDSPNTVDFSPLGFILALMAVITIPALIYALFFTVKCPPWTSSSRDNIHDDDHGNGSNVIQVTERITEPVSGLKYKEETQYSNEIGNECPVCLSVFADGEEVKQLSVCKHSFHTTCIDSWLTDHNNNCPICRATVDVKRPSDNNRGPPSRSARDGGGGGGDHQGLSDAASLV